MHDMDDAPVHDNWAGLISSIARLLQWILAVLVAIFFVLCLTVRSRAQETATGILCDTQDQATAIVQSGDAAHTARLINDSMGSEACAAMKATFYRGKPAATVRSLDGDLWDITPLFIIGMMNQPVEPSVQWSAFSSRLLEIKWDGKKGPNSAWYEAQKPTQETLDKYKIFWKSCCNLGDVCQECVVHRYSNKPPWTDGWYYVKNGVTTRLPDHIVEVVPWTPTGKPVLFLAPHASGELKKDAPVCLKVPSGGV